MSDIKGVADEERTKLVDGEEIRPADAESKRLANGEKIRLADTKGLIDAVTLADVEDFVVIYYIH